jgi:hypothetical protein
MIRRLESDGHRSLLRHLAKGLSRSGEDVMRPATTCILAAVLGAITVPALIWLGYFMRLHMQGVGLVLSLFIIMAAAGALVVKWAAFNRAEAQRRIDSLNAHYAEDFK